MAVTQKPILRNADPDKDAYRGLAMSQMGILKSYMKVAGLNVYSRVVTLANGVVITCKVCFNREDIFIDVPTAAPYGEAIVKVVEEEWSGIQINDNGSRKLLKFAAEAWTNTVMEEQTIAGNIDWRGSDGTVLSWRGVPSRYWGGSALTRAEIHNLVTGMVFGDYSTPLGVTPFEWLITQVLQPLPEGLTLADVDTSAYVVTEPLFSGRVWSGGRVIETGYGHVAGACLSGNKLCLICGGVQGFGDNEYILWADKDGKNIRGTTLLMTVGPVERTPWFFNASGTAAVATRGGHKWTLTLDPVNETYALVDDGPCASFRTIKTYAISGSVGSNFDGGPDWYYPTTVAQTFTTRNIFTHAVFDFIGDTETTLTQSRDTTGVLQWDTAFSGPPVSTGNTMTSSDSSNSTTQITLDGIVLADEASSRLTTSEVLGWWDGDYTRTNTRNSVGLTIMHADLRCGLVVFLRTTSEEAYTNTYTGADVPYSVTTSQQTTLSGHFDNTLTQVEELSASGTRPDWDTGSIVLAPPDAIGTMPPDTDVTVVMAASGTNIVAGWCVQDSLSQKLALSVPASYDANSRPQSWYGYLETSDLTNHGTVPCNPLCAIYEHVKTTTTTHPDGRVETVVEVLPA